MTFRRGDTFTHGRLLDVDWQPGPGQKYVDAPKAVCVITKVDGDSVYYRTAAGSKHVTSRVALRRMLSLWNG